MFLRRTTCLLALLFTLVGSVASAHADEESDASDERAIEKPEKHYLRTALAEALAIGGGTAWYWIDRERQVADWDFPSWSERLTTDVIRYDNNAHHVNFHWHAWNGASFHFLARANGLSFLESVGAGALTSLVWEYALEYREKVSMNDLIFTTGSGIALGEFVHLMGRYLNEDPEAAQWRAARWTLGSPLALSRALDGREPASLATKPDIWHEINVGYEVGLSNVARDQKRESHALHSIHADMRYVKLPGYLETGVWGGAFRSANFSRASIDVSGAAEGSAWKMFVDTTLLGYYNQQIHEDPDFLSNATMLGVSLAYRYRREEVGLWDDRVGVFHFPGLAAEARLQWREMSLDARGRAHYDFAGVNALSNEDWNAAHPFPEERGKSILRKMGYYYGYGPSASAELILRYGQVSLGGSAWLASYTSDEGLDRVQESLSIDQASSDRILDTRLQLRVEGLPYRGALGASYEYRHRDALLEEFEASASLRRVSISLGFAL